MTHREGTFEKFAATCSYQVLQIGVFDRLYENDFCVVEKGQKRKKPSMKKHPQRGAAFLRKWGSQLKRGEGGGGNTVLCKKPDRKEIRSKKEPAGRKAYSSLLGGRSAKDEVQVLGGAE